MGEIRDIIVAPLFGLETAGKDNRKKIDVGYHFHSLGIRIEGELNVTVAATLTEDGILNLIKNIIIELSDSKTPFNLNGELLYKMLKYDLNTPPVINQPAVGVAVNSFDVEFLIPFACLNGFPEEMTIFNSKKLPDGSENTLFNINFLLGVVSDVISAGTATLQNITCEVTGLQEINPLFLDIGHPLNRHTVKTVKQSLGAAGEYVTAVDLKSGNNLKRVLVIAETAAGLNDNDVLTQIRLRKGMNTYLKKISWKKLQGENKDSYSLESVEKGFAIIDVDKKEMFDQMLDTSQESQVYLEVVTSAAMLLTVATQELSI